MSDLISRQALCEYALNQKDKSVTPNDIMRFPSAQLIQCKECVYGNKMKDTIRCELMDYFPVECDHFCSYGVKCDVRRIDG